MSLGRPELRVDAVAKVTGAARYPGDRVPPDALVARVVFSDQPHARLRSLDTSAAEATDGVVFVLTSADVPVNEYGLTMFDQPVLVGPDHTGNTAVDAAVSRWEADAIAVVVAESEAAATAGASALVAEWEQLPLVLDIDAALADDAPLVHPEMGDSNAYYSYVIRKGDVVAGWDEADVIVEGTYEFPYQEHAYLQPEAAVAYVDDEGRVTVEIGGQWTHEDQEQIAHALALDVEEVRVIYPAIGGAFGGREDMTLQIVLALAAQRSWQLGLERPVVSVWSREESIVGHHKRHRGRVHTRWGATTDGRLVVVEADGYLDAGSYNYTTNKVLGNLHMCVAGPYRWDHARIDSTGVYTTTVPGGAFRGFGAPQGAFVAESQMNKLAEALDIDPVELRRMNGIVDGDEGLTGTEYPPGVSLQPVIEACAEAAGWADGPPDVAAVPSFATLPSRTDSVYTGRGFACAMKNVGFSFGFPERSNARIVLHGDAESDEPTSAELFLAGAEVGQGAHTAFTQMAAEATGLPVSAITPTWSDTATSGDSGSASASRLSWMTGNAILGAAEEADKAWRNGDRPAVGAFRFTPPPTDPLDPEGGPATPNFAYGYVAQAVTLSVDVDTGHIVVHDVVNCSDVGRVINPALLDGQVHGAVVQAHGYALSERLVLDDTGRIANPRFSGYLIPGIGDVPERIRSVVLEIPDPRGPFGVRGMAEMPMIPYAPAVAAALHDATGVWFERFPLTPPIVRATLREAGLGR